MTTFAKRSDWRVRLHAYLADARQRTFGYGGADGSQDCALFVAGAVEAMTGIDPAAEYRGRYTTLTGGLRVLRKAGYIDHVDLVAATLPEVRPAHLAQVGDIAVVPSGDDMVLGLVGGPRIFCWGEDALMTLDLLSISRAFRV